MSKKNKIKYYGNVYRPDYTTNETIISSGELEGIKINYIKFQIGVRCRCEWWDNNCTCGNGLDKDKYFEGYEAEGLTQNIYNDKRDLILKINISIRRKNNIIKMKQIKINNLKKGILTCKFKRLLKGGKLENIIESEQKKLNNFKNLSIKEI